MSSYPDDRFDDRRDDRFDDGRRDDRWLENARSAVRIPAAVPHRHGVLYVDRRRAGVHSVARPTRRDGRGSIADIEANKDIPADQKDMWKNILTSMKEFFEEPDGACQLCPVGVFGVLIILGGVKLMNLSGTGLPITGSILAMIPCTSSCCCLIGLPAGIWALVVLSRPDVKAAIAANRSGRMMNPDDQYVR